MALTEDFTKPDFVDLAADLAGIRDNFYFLLVSAVNGSIVIPGWATTINSNSSPQDFGEPDSVVLSRLDNATRPQVTRKIHIEYTWTGGNVTTMVIKYDDGVSSPSLSIVTGGTLTLSYDGSGNFTGATSA